MFRERVAEMLYYSLRSLNKLDALKEQERLEASATDALSPISESSPLAFINYFDYSFNLLLVAQPQQHLTLLTLTSLVLSFPRLQILVELREKFQVIKVLYRFLYIINILIPLLFHQVFLLIFFLPYFQYYFYLIFAIIIF